MTTAVLVPTAALAPGVCALSGDFNGPFIDTGTSVPGRGRIYLSVKALGPLMREAGWVPRSEVDVELTLNDEVEARLAAGEQASKRLDALAAAIAPFIPPPEPVVKQVAVVRDKQVQAENERLTAEIARLRQQVSIVDAPEVAAPAPESEGSTPVEAGAAAPSVITVHGSEINLTDLLSETTQTIREVVKGWPDDAIEAVVLAEMDRDNPRKMILRLAD
jgi:hypothetical protein